MKKIGIVGGLSAESTIEYYKILIREYNKQMGGASSPLLVIDSLNLEIVRNLMVNNNWDEVYSTILSSVRNLEKAGAGIIIIATNTIHKIYEQLSNVIKTPIISIMDATAETIKKKKLKKIGLLGTIFTMQDDFYPLAFAKYDLEIIPPSEKDQEYINKVIWEELTHNILKEESRTRFLEVIKRLQAKGAEGVILGCTEIPLLIKQEDCNIPVFDTTTIHALAVLKKAIE